MGVAHLAVLATAWDAFANALTPSARCWPGSTLSQPRGDSKRRRQPQRRHGNRQHCGDSQDFYGDVHLPIQPVTLESFNVSA